LSAALGALAIGLAQTRGLFTLKAIGRRKDLEREGRSTAWALAACLVLLGVLVARELAVGFARSRGTDGAVTIVLHALGRLGPRALLLIAAAGLGDWAWRRLRLERALRMTRGEVERERREEEGDPRLKAERRRRHRLS
jgi:flagellar biosynthesis protein FlhB